MQPLPRPAGAPQDRHWLPTPPTSWERRMRNLPLSSPGPSRGPAIRSTLRKRTACTALRAPRGCFRSTPPPRAAPRAQRRATAAALSQSPSPAPPRGRPCRSPRAACSRPKSAVKMVARCTPIEGPVAFNTWAKLLPSMLTKTFTSDGHALADPFFA